MFHLMAIFMLVNNRLSPFVMCIPLNNKYCLSYYHIIKLSTATCLCVVWLMTCALCIPNSYHHIITISLDNHYYDQVWLNNSCALWALAIPSSLNLLDASSGNCHCHHHIHHHRHHHHHPLSHHLHHNHHQAGPPSVTIVVVANDKGFKELWTLFDPLLF